MTRSQTLRRFKGSQVSVSLRNGSRLDDCQLVSAGRTGTTTLWLFSNGNDVFVSQEDVIDVWESCAA